MSRFFNYDTPLVAFLNKVFDLILLNLLFVLTSLPIFTAGAALTALNHTLLRYQKGTDSGLISDYFHSFKINFKQATLLWLGVIGIIGLLVADIFLVQKFGSAFQTLLFVFYALLLITLWLLQFLFPLQSLYYNPLKQTLKNAFWLSYRHPLTTLFSLFNSFGLIIGIPLLFPQATHILLIYYILCGFAVTVYLNSRYINQVLEKQVLSA